MDKILSAMMVNTIAAPYEAIMQVNNANSESEIRRLKSDVRYHKSRAEYYEQLYIHERQLREQSK